MEFSAMVLNMFLPDSDSSADDRRIIPLATEQSLRIAELGFNPWYTDHHFRGPWHSNPMQFAAYIAPQIPRERYIGFGVLSAPFYHPVRLVESMNLLDQLMEGRTLYGIGSGWPGLEPDGLGVDAEHHASGRAAEDTLNVMQRLWAFRTGDDPYTFEVGSNRGTIKRRITPASYRNRHPILIRTASRDAALVTAARNGWPAFLGIFGADLRQQARIYRQALAESAHTPEVIDECMRWCTYDWLSVVVADTDEEAQRRARAAQAEQMAIRRRYIQAFGKMDGPVARRQPGESNADAYAAGGDMKGTIAGSPDTVAAEIQKLVAVGINHLMVRFLGEWAGETRSVCETSLQLFSREIIPRFKHVAPLRDPLALDLDAVR
jgi:alkanesulfonate monooxygenase SsuD/methylene tetrahydromethanopterin reductase-like flavin-dependent oxidoreductase (luciferase family)